MVRVTIHEFVRRDLLPREPNFLNARTREEKEQIVQMATAKIKEMGLYSAGVPEEFGGGGLGPIETCLIAEELSTTIIPVEWGDLTPILYECSAEQRPEYLLPVVAGEKRYALAFREKTHFASADDMTTFATPNAADYRLNGVKLLSRPDFDFCLVFALTPEGPSCFIVDRNTPGTEIVWGTVPAELHLNDCRIPKEKMLGQPGTALFLGQRWFGIARIIRSAAILGICSRILETTAQYARDWKSMNEPIASRQEVQNCLATMAGNIESLRWLVYYTAWCVTTKDNINFESMLLKFQAHHILQETVNTAVRVHGGPIPPIQHWLVRATQEGEALNMLTLAVSNEVIKRYAV